jgi:hypothetical protein
MAQMKTLPLLAALLLALAAPAVRAQATPDKADQAHALMGQGDAAGALLLMQEHVAEHPEDRAARLDLTRYLLWNGALAKAEKVLLADPAAADSEEGRGLHAYLLASAGRLREARALDAPLLAATPEAFQPNFSESLALMQSTRPMLAMPYTDTLKRQQPDSKDIIDLERRAWVRRASFVSLGYTARSSTDDISSDLPTLWGEFRLNDRLRLTGEYGYWRYGVDDGGPFEAIDGGDVHESRGMLGLRYAPTEYSEVQLALGNSSIEGDSTSVWRARGDVRFNDSFSAALLFDRDRIAASPRSLSLGLTRTGSELQLQLTPDLNWTANLWLRRDDGSDDNTRTNLIIAARRATLRLPKFSLDLGGVLEKQHFDFDPGNGYYAPDDYKRYGITAHGYVGLGAETGLSLHAVLGRQRDETFDSWQSANDFDATLIFGSLSKWEGRVTAAYTQRAQTSGAYEAVMWAVQVTRRF